MRGRGGIELALHPPDKGVDARLIRLLFTRRRHHAAAQLADRRLPHLRIVGDALRLHRVERDASGPIRGVVTFLAVVAEHVPARIGRGSLWARHALSIDSRRERGQQQREHWSQSQRESSPHTTPRISRTWPYRPMYAFATKSCGLPHFASYLEVAPAAMMSSAPMPLRISCHRSSLRAASISCSPATSARVCTGPLPGTMRVLSSLRSMSFCVASTMPPIHPPVQ